jgi:Flp pilus assembly protein TadB
MKRVPRNVYRDSAILYGVLAVAIVAFAAVTGGDLVRACVVAVAFFALAIGWSWYRWRSRAGTEGRR